MKQRMRIGIIAGLAAAFVSAAPQVYAQSGPWPNKPIRMIVASGAGGGLDFVARADDSILLRELGD